MTKPSRDVDAMLASLQIDRHPGVLSVVSIDEANLSSTELQALERAAFASVREAEGRTFVVAAEFASAAGLTSVFDGVWLTLRVWSALDAVGLTAAVSTALAKEGVACNVFAGAYHDHLLVPVDAAERAIAVLER